MYVLRPGRGVAQILVLFLLLLLLYSREGDLSFDFCLF